MFRFTKSTSDFPVKPLTQSVLGTQASRDSKSCPAQKESSPGQGSDSAFEQSAPHHGAFWGHVREVNCREHLSLGLAGSANEAVQLGLPDSALIVQDSGGGKGVGGALPTLFFD